MKTDSKADVFIYSDESDGLKRAQMYVEVNIDDAETAAYYNDIIKIKRAYEGLKGEKKFLFYHYFFLEFELALLPDNQPETQKDNAKKLKETLAKACCDFAKVLGAKYNKTIFMQADTYKHNVHSKEKNEAIDYIYEKVKEYNTFIKRAIDAIAHS